MATESPTPKKIRSQPADVTVAVGRGDAMQEFECYKVVLSFASPYFDSMLSVNMAESTNSRIQFLDKDPEEWKLFYKVIDPSTRMGLAKPNVSMSEEDAMTLVPWFHEFQMDSYLAECDEVLSKKAISIAHYSHYYWIRQSGSDSRKRRRGFAEIMELLGFACMYDLEKTRASAEQTIQYLLEAGYLVYTLSLFDRATVEKLIELFLPLVEVEGTSDEELDEESDDGESSNDKHRIESRGKSKVLWEFLQNNDFDEQCLKGYPLDAINKNETMLTLLVEAKMQQYASDEELQIAKSTAKDVVHRWMDDLPDEMYNKTGNEDSRKCLKRMLKGQFETHKESLKSLGIALPYSYGRNRS